MKLVKKEDFSEQDIQDMLKRMGLPPDTKVMFAGDMDFVGPEAEALIETLQKASDLARLSKENKTCYDCGAQKPEGVSWATYHSVGNEEDYYYSCPDCDNDDEAQSIPQTELN